MLTVLNSILISILVALIIAMVALHNVLKENRKSTEEYLKRWK